MNFKGMLWICAMFGWVYVTTGHAVTTPVAAPPPPPSVSRAKPLPLPAQASDDEQLWSMGLALQDEPMLHPMGAETTLRERAEDLSGVTLQPADPVYDVVQAHVVVEGINAFHLAHPEFADLLITLDTPVLVEADTRAFFKSRLRYATEYQVARFQISTNAGTSWETLWSRAGDETPGQTFFEKVSVDLSAYAGQTVQFRFYYDYLSGGSAFTGTDTHYGWFIDDIQVGPTFITRPYKEIGEPSLQEILAIEFINRARADAAAEAERLRHTDDQYVVNAVDYFDVDFDEMENQFAELDQVAPPLAINSRLTAAARLHTQDMLNNVFQGHTSSDDPPPPHQPLDGLVERVEYQGYSWERLGENVYAYGHSVWHSHAAFNIDWGPDTWHGMQDPPGHRLSIHNPDFKEIGVGIFEGENSDNGDSVGPMLSTQNFGTDRNRNQPFLVGVTFVAHDESFYAADYALGGVTVQVDGSGFHAVSSTHGAYAVPLPGDGVYTVTFNAPGYVAYTTEVTVSDNQNVKVDYIAQIDPQAVWLEALSRRPDGGLRFEIEYPHAAQDLQVRVSHDLNDWEDHGATFTSLGGGRYQVDCDPVFGAAAFFKVVATP